MKNTLEKFVEVYEIFCRILLLSMSVLVISFVFLRYFFGITFVWAEELITMLFISTTYFGAVLGMKYKGHINIGFFIEQLPGTMQRVVDIFNHLIILGLQIAIIILSANWIGRVGDTLTSGMRLPIKYFYYMMPISSVLIGCYCISHIAILIAQRHVPYKTAAMQD